MLPYEHADRAAAGLRAELRRPLLHADVHEMPEWDTCTVTGPVEIVDARDRQWCEYRGSVESGHPFDVKTH